MKTEHRTIISIIIVTIGALFHSARCLADDGAEDEESKFIESGTQLFLGGSDVYRELHSYRCRIRFKPDADEWRFAYSGSKYRIEYWLDKKLSEVVVFDGETHAKVATESMAMSQARRTRPKSPRAQSPFDICFDLFDVGLDTYHRPDFLQARIQRLTKATAEDFNAHPCFVLASFSEEGSSRHIWVAKDLHGFPLATEAYNSQGDLSWRREVREFKVFPLGTQSLVFPTHIYTLRPSAPPFIRESHCRVDPETIEINPSISLSEFRLDTQKATSVYDLDTGDTTLANGNVMTSDSKLISPNGSDITNMGYSGGPVVPGKPELKRWMWLSNIAAILLILAYIGVKAWRRKSSSSV